MSGSVVLSSSTYVHRFIAGKSVQPPLLLLHRTGGSENDLVAVAGRIAPGAPLLALRGDVLEDGKPRFFRRIGKGHFDLDDLAQRTLKLADFIDWARAHYRIGQPVAFGFSNGANIAMSLVITRPSVLRGAILMRPMWAHEPARPPTLGGFPVLVIGGRDDTTVRPELARKTPAFLTAAGADVDFQWAAGAHDLTDDDERFSVAWLERFRPA
jgi:phospholipase/carboxylesterase